MQSRLTGILDTYDVLGKAIPGIAWFFGFLLLLPADLLSIGSASGSNPNEALRLGRLATLLVIALIVGLVFGQGIDSLARLLERLFAWVRKQFHAISEIGARLAGGVSVWGGRTYELLTMESSIAEAQEGAQSARRIPLLITPAGLLITLTGIYVLTIAALRLIIGSDGAILFAALVAYVAAILWMYHYIYDENSSLQSFVSTYSAARVTSEFPRVVPSKFVIATFRKALSVLIVSNTALTSHRELFGRYIATEPHVYTSPTDNDQIAYGHLELLVDESYNFNLDELGEEENEPDITELYLFLRSHLDANGITRAAGFQARYSFCRSMWMATAVFTLLYSGVYLSSDHSTSAEALTPSIISGVPINSISNFLVVAGVLVISASILEMVFRKVIDAVPPFLSWAGGTSFTLLFLQTTYSSESAILVKAITENVLRSTSELVLSVLIWIGQVCTFVFGYTGQDTVPVITSVFGTATPGILGVLAVSSLAFFSATASYKTNYIEYIVTDTWESVRDSQNVSPNDSLSGSEDGK